MSDNVDILARIQAQIVAPKGKHNSFGNFDYRSAEDILAAIKPVLLQFDQSIVLSDEIVEVAGRIYIKSTAVLHPCGAHSVAYAREAAEKKGMDVAQVTGSASSYARKYALAGLFALDNNKDPDTDEHTKERTEAETEAQAEAKRLIQLDIDGCDTLDCLSALWGRLSKHDKVSMQAAFTKRKEDVREAGE